MGCGAALRRVARRILRTRCGGGIGGLTGRAWRGAVVAVMRPSELTEVVKRGERRRRTTAVPLVGGLTELGGGSGSAAEAFWKMKPRRVSWLSEVSLSWCGKCPLIKLASLPAAAMTASSEVTDGFEMYLCLWKTVADTRVHQIFAIQMINARSARRMCRGQSF